MCLSLSSASVIYLMSVDWSHNYILQAMELADVQQESQKPASAQGMKHTPKQCKTMLDEGHLSL